MGLPRIFLCAVAGTLIPTVILLYLVLTTSPGSSTELVACQAAQGFVKQSIGADKTMSFLPCGQGKAVRLKGLGETWQVMGDVEVTGPQGEEVTEAYLVRLQLGDGAPHLETLSLR